MTSHSARRSAWSRVVAPVAAFGGATPIEILFGSLVGVVTFFVVVWGLYFVLISFVATAPCELAADPVAACRDALPEVLR